jgi:perosamine synthetase
VNNFIPQIVPQLGEAEAHAVQQYMQGGAWLTEHTKTTEFESELKQFTGAKHCIVVPSGTVALSLALLGAGIRPGDEVIVPALTMAASATAALMIGATVSFCDIEDKELNLDSSKIKLSNKTRAVIHVSLNGRAGTLLDTQAFCKKNNLFLIEDAAQSLGSFCAGRHLGTIGDAGILSFSSPKLITTGQGGALLTNNDSLAERVRHLKDFGRATSGQDIYNSIGYNFKFTDLQAVIGLVQLQKIRQQMNLKKSLFDFYKKNLNGLVDFLATDLEACTPWFMDIYLDNRDQLQAALKADGIGSRSIYPCLTTQNAFANSTVNQTSFPVAEKIAKRGLWLPSSANLNLDQRERICNSIKRFVT